jgi:dephospho-CoA kinase
MRIGLTGGIACGKSTVAAYLQDRYGIPVLSADRYANYVLENLIPDKIIDRFGPGILQGGKIDRKALGRIVFSQPEERAWLESKIHPVVKELMSKDVSTNTDQTVVLEIPLLFEAKMTDLVHQIWVVSCSEQKMIERLQRRNQLTIQECQDRIKAQMPIQLKRQLADIILENEGTLAELYQQVDRVYQSLQQKLPI